MDQVADPHAILERVGSGRLYAARDADLAEGFPHPRLQVQFLEQGLDDALPAEREAEYVHRISGLQRDIFRGVPIRPGFVQVRRDNRYAVLRILSPDQDVAGVSTEPEIRRRRNQVRQTHSPLQLRRPRPLHVTGKNNRVL